MNTDTFFLLLESFRRLFLMQGGQTQEGYERSRPPTPLQNIP